jgi:hypothetical protein
MSLLAQTLRLAFQIAIVWSGGFILAVVAQAALPEKIGISLPSNADIFVPYSRIGFWTCMLAALTVTALVVIRAMLMDFGVRPMR